MKLIAAAGAVLFLMFGSIGTASGANLVPVAPSNYFDSNPSFLTGPPTDRRVFIAERGKSSTGVAGIRIIDGNTRITEPFLSIPNVALNSERGLMSMAFAPNYGTSGRFYVFYTAAGSDALDPTGQAGDIRIVEYRVSENPNLADPNSARLVLKIPHTAGNHNGGWMGFDPSGRLYIAVGDNASSANSQNQANLLGKILRIDPTDPDGSGPARYSIPSDNPYASVPSARGEIYTLGLRNPYRGDFLPDGRLAIGDVGEGSWEEVNVGDLAGKNLGWPNCEGFCVPFNPAYTDPFFAYDHPGEDGGCSVIGGHVVEDPALTGLTGRYIYGDYCRGKLRTLDLTVPGGNQIITDLDTFGNPVAFGQDAPGCSYVLTSGEAFRIAENSSAGVACQLPFDPANPPPPPEPPADVEYTSYIPNRAVIALRLQVGAKCSISCAAKATARYKITRNRFRKKPLTFRPAAVNLSLKPNVRTPLRIQVGPNRVRQMRKAIRNGSRVTAYVTVSMTGADSSGGSGSKKVRLIRKGR